MMITPFTERTCYLFLSTSFSLSFSPSLSPRPTVYLDAKTCIERGKRRAPSILYRSIDPCFFFACDPRCDTNSCSHGRTSRERYPDGGAITSCTVIPDKFGINVSGALIRIAIDFGWENYNWHFFLLLIKRYWRYFVWYAKTRVSELLILAGNSFDAVRLIALRVTIL